MTATSDEPQFPSCTIPAASRTEVFLRYLDYFRSRVIAKTAALGQDEASHSRLPSGWTPAELVKHLTYMERRWLEWGFEGHQVPEPWGDHAAGRWHVGADESLDDLLSRLRERGQRTTAIVTAHDLAEIGQPGERWAGAEPASLERVLLHMLQEYARHAGHLDIVAELAGSQTGE